jgi:hypothetical protein
MEGRRELRMTLTCDAPAERPPMIGVTPCPPPRAVPVLSLCDACGALQRPGGGCAPCERANSRRLSGRALPVNWIAPIGVTIVSDRATKVGINNLPNRMVITPPGPSRSAARWVLHFQFSWSVETLPHFTCVPKPTPNPRKGVLLILPVDQSPNTYPSALILMVYLLAPDRLDEIRGTLP